METQQVELTVKFRLDGEGRTVPTLHRSPESTPHDSSTTTATPDQPSPCCSNSSGIDYQSKTVMTCFEAGADKTSESLLDDLLFDAEISDSGLMPRTFWVGVGDEARFSLEEIALSIFRHHVPADAKFDRETSGAEWWCQLRPSPTAGRYVMHANDELTDEISRKGIWWHWDKDEDLRQLLGGDYFIHPHISTVTYLTSHGAPTIAVNRRVHPFTGDVLVQDDSHDEAFISWPRQGKHLSFDGRYLHGATPDLLPEQVLQQSQPVSHNAKNDSSESENVKITRRQRRVTFLVNIWLNYRPFNVEPFPETMVDKMSGSVLTDRVRITFSPRSLLADEVQADPETETDSFEWPMGGDDSNESISMPLPLCKIQKKHIDGDGNIRVLWAPGCITINKNNPAKKQKTST